MGRVDELMDRLSTARAEVLALLADGPKKTGDLLDGLGYSGVNFMLTKAIGDEHGEWDNSPHQLAQSDLIDEGEVQWHRDEKLDVEYALHGTWPNGECGDFSPSAVRADRFLDIVANLLGKPEEDDADDVSTGVWWIASNFNCREIEDKDVEDPFYKVHVSCDGEIVLIDYISNADGEESEIKFPWPGCEGEPELVAAAVRKIFDGHKKKACDAETQIS